MANNLDFKRKLQAEMAKHPDILLSFENGGKHPRLRLSRGDRSRIVVYSLSASDKRADMNRMADVRRVIAELRA